jgi:hypothetical protein
MGKKKGKGKEKRAGHKNFNKAKPRLPLNNSISFLLF